MLVKKPCNEKGIIDQPKRLNKSVRIGAIIKLKTPALFGITVSFSNSFKPSANGCNRPI